MALTHTFAIYIFPSLYIPGSDSVIFPAALPWTTAVANAIIDAQEAYKSKSDAARRLATLEKTLAPNPALYPTITTLSFWATFYQQLCMYARNQGLKEVVDLNYVAETDEEKALSFPSGQHVSSWNGAQNKSSLMPYSLSLPSTSCIMMTPKR